MDTLEYIVEKFNVDLTKGPHIHLDCDRNVALTDLLQDLGFKTGVEVGVLEGEYSEVLCKTNPEMKIFSVDAWLFYPVYKNFRKQWQYDRVYKTAVERLSVYSNNQIIKKKSVEAAEDFEDESIDFVYIDADHSFPAITSDIATWSKKVRKGGLIIGHDYGDSPNKQFCHVKTVVNAWTSAYGIAPLFILDCAPSSRFPIKYPDKSWMWVKQ